MAHFSLPSLQAEIAAEASKALAAGIRFAVVVENARGEWFALHADDQGHAARLAQHWVDVLGCRGADCFRVFPDGLGPEPFHQVFEDFGDEALDYPDFIEGELA